MLNLVKEHGTSGSDRFGKFPVEVSFDAKVQAKAIAEATATALGPVVTQMQSIASQFGSFATLVRTQHLLEAMIHAKQEGETELFNKLKTKYL